jgi:glycosyltransferase involved in cell wall biosynthesis
LRARLFVDATVVPSEHLRRQILANQRIAPHRIKTVYPGVDFDGLDADLDRPLPADLQQWIDAGDGPLLVHVGMFRREKGHRVALEAIAKARRHLPNLRYIAAGSGPLEAEIRAQIGVLGLGSSVWVGEVRPVAPLLKQADLFLMPSLAEPLGMAQIEALGLGVPVIASDVDGIPETVAHLDTGILAPPGDVRKWAESIELAVTHTETMRFMAERGRADVRSRFSVALNTSTLLGLMARRH